MNLRFNMTRTFKTQVLMLVITLLPACSTAPKNLRSAPELSPLVSDVQMAPEPHQGEVVRWGGSIVSVNHANGETVVQIVSRPLSSNSRPTGIDQTDGRFLAIFEGFLETEIYQEKRLLTVLGRLDGVNIQKIGNLDYAFPVLRVQEHHLWQKESLPVYPYRRGGPWEYWGSPYPYFYYDGFYSSLWRHRPPRPHRH